MQNTTINPLTVARIVLMAVGLVFFFVFGSWSLSHMEDKSMVRGTADSQPRFSRQTVLPL